MKINAFQAGVGLSRSWDPKKAGEEVVVTTLEKLDKDPNFFLLFSTIHFAKEKNGMQKFVEAAYDQLPKGTPMIGGTVCGFINPYGCYARGATGLAVYSEDMDISIGTGNNTKKNPQNAGRMAADMINDQLTHNRESTVLFDCISGPIIPKLPILGDKKYIKSKTFSKLLEFGLYLSARSQKGFGREQEVLEGFTKKVNSYPIMGVSTFDDNKLQKNYIFHDNQLLENSIIVLGIESDLKYHMKTTHGFKQISKKLKINKTGLWGYMLNEINGKSALDSFLEEYNWKEDILKEDTLYKNVFYYPVGFFTESGEIYPATIGAIWGENLVCGSKNTTDDVVFLGASGDSMIESTKDALYSDTKIKPYFGLGVLCAMRMITFGDKIYRVKNILDDYFGNVPYLALVGGGENRYLPEHGATNFTASVEFLILGE